MNLRGRPWSKSVAEARPDLINEWHPTKNGSLTPHDIAFKWWRCPRFVKHDYESTAASRIGSRTGCPYCEGKKVCEENCLATVKPTLIREWHPIKNGLLTPNDVIAFSHKIFWWKCLKRGHEWQASLTNRVGNDTNCPYCSNNKVCDDNCLATINPKLSKEWHPTKNGLLTPKDIIAKSPKKVWWRCHKGHEWLVSPDSRINGNKIDSDKETDCPFCKGNKVCDSNCLATIRPDIAKEWHSTRNGELTPRDITPGSNKKIWWKCSKFDNHEWLTTPHSRLSMESNCPLCYLAPRSLMEILIAFELKQFFDINLDNHKIVINNKNYDVDIIIENLSVIIEYDGKYWHKDKFESDCNKTKLLTAAGWFVIRIREHPLEKINIQDFLLERPLKNSKKVVDSILSYLNNKFNLNLNLDKYLERSDLINKSVAKEYTEKYKISRKMK